MIEVRELGDQDRAWIREIAQDLWGAEIVVGHGERDSASSPSAKGSSLGLER